MLGQQKSADKTYKIYRGGIGYTITVTDRGRTYRLIPTGRFSTGFCWGKGLPCASEASLGILSDAIGRRKAELLHTLFKWDVVANLKGIGWELREDWIVSWARQKLSELRKKNKVIAQTGG